MARAPREIPGPHWDPRAPTLQSYLSEVAAARGESSAEAVDCRAERLKYMLIHTLGCSMTFEGRRRELRVLQEEGAVGVGSSDVSDDEVVESFLADVQPGGALRAYLEHACIACVLGSTIFVHGALEPTSIRLVPLDSTRFYLPPTPQPMREVDTVAAWVEEMNGVLRRGLAAHLARPEWDDERRTRGGEVLMALQNRCAMHGRCVVSGAYSSGGCITHAAVADLRRDVHAKAAETGDANQFERILADPLDGEVAAWLRKEGIRRVVVGHKPSGDSPAVLSAAATGVEIISADTSYADREDVLGRGQSLAGVTIRGQSLARNHARVFGTLSDGREHDASLATLDSKGSLRDAPGDPLIGTEIGDGWWVKALVSTNERNLNRYLCCRGIGRKVEYRDEVRYAD